MKFIVHKLETCGSTNDAVRGLAAAGAPEGTVVVAGEQTAGRGTKGRSWHSPPGLGLYASFLLRPASEGIALLPIAAGIAARDAVEASHGLAARLLWPNDIVFDGRKLGGVLCESSTAGGLLELAILGIGINVNHGPEDFPAELRETAISLGEALGRRADSLLLLDALLAAVDSRLSALARGDVAGLVRAFNDRSALRPGDPVFVSADGPALVRGSYPRPSAAENDPQAKPGVPAAARRFLYDGIGSDGALLVRDPSGTLSRFLSAEIRKAL